MGVSQCRCSSCCRDGDDKDSSASAVGVEPTRVLYSDTLHGNFERKGAVESHKIDPLLATIERLDAYRQASGVGVGKTQSLNDGLSTATPQLSLDAPSAPCEIVRHTPPAIYVEDDSGETGDDDSDALFYGSRLSNSCRNHGMRLSGIAEGQAPVRWRLNFIMLGPGAWTLTNDLVHATPVLFPTGAAPKSPSTQEFQQILSNGGIRGLDFKRIVSTPTSASGQPFSHMFAASFLLNPEDDRKVRISRTSFETVVSDEEKDGATTKCARVGFTPVEFFTEEVPSCDSLDDLMTTCFIFLADSRMHSSEVLSDLARRQREVESRVWRCLKANKSTEMPPLLFSIIMHESPSPTKDDLADYHKFVESVRNLSKAKDEEVVLHTCDFQDSEALAVTVVGMCGKIISTRKLEDVRNFKPSFPTYDSTNSELGGARRGCCKCVVM